MCATIGCIKGHEAVDWGIVGQGRKHGAVENRKVTRRSDWDGWVLLVKVWYWVHRGDRFVMDRDALWPWFWPLGLHGSWAFLNR